MGGQPVLGHQGHGHLEGQGRVQQLAQAQTALEGVDLNNVCCSSSNTNFTVAAAAVAAATSAATFAAVIAAANAANAANAATVTLLLPML